MVHKKILKKIKSAFKKADVKLRGFLPGGITPSESRAQRSQKKAVQRQQEAQKKARKQETKKPATSISRSGKAALVAKGIKFAPEQRSRETLDVEKGTKQVAFFERQLAEGKFDNPKEETELINAIIESKKDLDIDIGRQRIEEQKPKEQPQQKLSEREQIDKDIVKGLKTGLLIGIPLAIAIVTVGLSAIGALTLGRFVSSGSGTLIKSTTGALIKKPKGAIELGGRAVTNINKLVRQNKISKLNADKVIKRINSMKLNEIAKMLTKPSILKPLFTVQGQVILQVGLAGFVGIPAWFAADNMSSGAKINSNGLINRVKFGDMEKDLAIEVNQEYLSIAKTARSFMVGAMIAAPLIAPFGLLYLTQMRADIRQIELNEFIINGL